jgi:hypothetical protein
MQEFQFKKLEFSIIAPNNEKKYMIIAPNNKKILSLRFNLENYYFALFTTKY